MQRQGWGTMFLQPFDGWFYILRFCSWPVRASLSAGKACHGAGDIFLSGAAALWLAPVSVPLFLFLSASSAAIAGMVLLFLGRMSRRRGFLSARSSRWEVWRRMARKYFSFRSFHRGTVLFEVLLAAVILSLAALAVIPLYTGWRSEKRLELAAEEVASAIRQVEILAKNESADYPSMSEGLTFFVKR